MPWEPITTLEHLRARFENSMFDVKTTYDTTQIATRYDIAKDVAAFATAFGGTIVVGVKESAGKVIALPGIADRSKLLSEIATSLQLHCSPLPATPEEHEIIVTAADAVHLLAPGVPVPTSDVVLLALNVRADPKGPIGVRPFGGSGPTQGTYRFPIRVADQTAFLAPTELAMWMNSHERKVALQLRQIPRVDGGKALVRIFSLKGNQLEMPTFLEDIILTKIDDSQQFVEVEKKGGVGPARIPFTFIASVWQEPGDGAWQLAIRGSVYPISESNMLQKWRFRPYLGGA